MKKLFTIVLSMFAYFYCMNAVMAADLLVAENGAGGAYPSITDAINASADGDRIIVTPKSGGAPYAENLVIEKSLQFLSAVEGDMFVMQGSITLTPANGRTFSFIGLKNLQGNLDGQMNNAAGTRCIVNILNCDFESGNINLNYDYYKLNLASSIIKGKVTFRYGNAYGNQITTAGSGIVVNTDAAATNDTIWIVGNMIYSSYAADYYYGIYFNSTSQFFSIYNNYVKTGDSYYYNTYIASGIYINAAKNSNTGKNFIVNNTLTRDNINTWGNYTTMGIGIANIPANATVEAMNNLIVGDNTYSFVYGLYGNANTGTVATSYTYFVNTSTKFTNIVDNGTNNTNSNTTIDVDGRPAPASDAVNGANPDSIYYDINLTVGDVGCYGGSFTLDNFFPITGAARVYFVAAPRRVLIGNTINIKAEAFDR